MCHHLGYSATKFKQENNKKNLIALLEDWITTGEKEGRPKTWSMFIEVLSDVNELSAVTSEIRSELNKAGVCTGEYVLVVHLQASVLQLTHVCYNNFNSVYFDIRGPH